jgi:hypothetical protein
MNHSNRAKVIHRYNPETLQYGLIATGTKLLKATTDDDDNMVAGYQNLVGSQMYAMLCTRPDLAFGISQISQFGTNPTSTHEAVAKQVMRYLNGTSDLGITYDGSGTRN